MLNGEVVAFLEGLLMGCVAIGSALLIAKLYILLYRSAD